ncbi:hypothetical protein FOMPIDRAFT_1022380 [Fomitopsis schrenkii]|uniref:Uncharacterized protein n=1 Tax=Fomitopsis schrenkii TaxID=2126942 RepID=S8EGG0_FOMSC|nr:hypothetical protein FOMPIDRAFT_1022380 [Fomitopsis schrenkii]
MPWQYEFSADAQSGQSTPGATPPISSTIHGRDAPPNGSPKADAEGSSGRSGAPQCPSIKADPGGVSDGPPIRSAVPSKNESSVMSGLSAQQQGPSIVVANGES